MLIKVDTGDAHVVHDVLCCNYLVRSEAIIIEGLGIAWLGMAL